MITATASRWMMESLASAYRVFPTRLLCNWFRNAVLPADHELLADVMRERPGKRCAVCGKPVYSSSNRAKYCPVCAKQERRKQDAKRKREQYWNLRK